MDIKIVSHSEADEIVPDPPPDLYAVVSIFSPPASRMATWVNTHGKIRTQPCLGFDEFPGPKIALSFDDANVEGHNVFVAQEEDMKRFLNWADAVPFPLEGRTILFHCHAGIARSVSVALAFLLSKLGPGSEEYCLNAIALARPQAWPNDLIVDLADRALGCNGQLNDAVYDWKQAAKAAGIYS